MNNATFESILAITFAVLVILIPFIIIAMIWPSWLGEHITLLGKWIDLSLLHGLQTVTSKST